MKNYATLLLMLLTLFSCSKKVEFSGKMVNAAPLDRLEIIDASGVGTLPLVNVGVEKDGSFKGSFEAPQDGMYVLNFAGKQALVYLKAGKDFTLNANALTFPKFSIGGPLKADNDFLQATQDFLVGYTAKLDMQKNMQLPENQFVASLKKIQADLYKNIEENAKKFSADDDVVRYKKNDINAGILSVISQYEMVQSQMRGGQPYKASKALQDYEASLQENKDALIEKHALYRSYLLTKMNDDFQKFATPKAQGKTDLITGELFKEFLAGKKQYSQKIKDYLMAFVISQADIRPDQTPANLAKISKLVDSDIKDDHVKKDLQNLLFAISGPKIGEAAPQAALIKADGSSYDVASKGRSKMLMFYASWNPYIAATAIPVFKEVVKFYGKKMDFVAVNFDDTKNQFVQTSNAMFKGTPVINVYPEGALGSDFAKKYGIYSFKLSPSYIVIDRDGKVASTFYYNLGDQKLIDILDRQTGLKAPVAPQPEFQLQNDLLAPQNAAPAAPAQPQK